MQFEKNLCNVVMLGQEPNTNYFIDLHAISIVTALQTIGIQTFGSCQGHRKADVVAEMETRPQIEFISLSCNPYLMVKRIVEIFNLIHPEKHHVKITPTLYISSLHFGENSGLMQAQLDLHTFANLCLIIDLDQPKVLERYIMLSDKSNEILKKNRSPKKFLNYHKNLIKRNNLILEKATEFKKLQKHPYVSTFINEGMGL